MNQAPTKPLTDHDLLYAATVRCKCGAGLACPLDIKDALLGGAWSCADVLKGQASPDVEHDAYPFSLWKIREETSINNTGGHTTRPAGTVARTVGTATCPQCGTKWKSEPYDANGAGHHWLPGPCPACGYTVGADSTWSSGDGPAIDARYRDVVVLDASM